MKVVTARRANQAFSKLLADVEAGEDVIITKRGRAVARVTPMLRPLPDAKREAAIKRAVALMRKGMRLGGRRFSRDEMHER